MAEPYNGNVPDYLVLLIARVERQTGLLFSERLSQFDLTYPEFRLVGILLGQTRGISQKALAARLGLDPSSISVALARLEKKGIVVRERDESDLRNMRVRCAARVPRLEEVMAAVAELDEVAMNGLTPEEKESLRGLLRRIGANLETYRAPQRTQS
jgi:DNA-binding MarR family transcriptional regulator